MAVEQIVGGDVRRDRSVHAAREPAEKAQLDGDLVGLALGAARREEQVVVAVPLLPHTRGSGGGAVAGVLLGVIHQVDVRALLVGLDLVRVRIRVRARNRVRARVRVRVRVRV